MKRLPVYLAMIFLTACAVPGPLPDDEYYRLPPVSAAVDPRPLTDGVIFVEQFFAEGIYRERSLLYSDDPEGLVLKRYHYHHWIVTPSRLIRDHFIDYLRAAREAAQVVSTADIPAQLSIYGRIRHFERRLTASGVTVVVGLEFRVNRASAESPLLLKAYNRSEELRDDSMTASVRAFARLLGDIYGELVEDIRARGG